MTLLQRLLENSTMDVVTKCWLWKGYTDEKGYGRIKWNRKTIRVHRASAIAHGIIKEDDETTQANHKKECPNRNCWNPEHIYAGTHEDNMKDMVELNHVKSSKKRARLCKNGHDLDKTGFYISGKNRCCKLCKQESYRRKKSNV